MRQDELMHYGVPGMRWGHRKARPLSAERSRYVNAKATYKADKKAYSKAYDKAYSYSGRHLISQFVGKKQKAESDRRWKDVDNKATQLNKSKSTIKQAKKEYKQSAEYKAKRAKALKTGAAVAGAALAIYGTYKLSKFIGEKNTDIRINEGRAKCDRMVKKLDEMRLKDLASTGGPNIRFHNPRSYNRTGFQYSRNGRDVRLAREYRKTAPTLKREQYNNIETRIAEKTMKDAFNKAENDSFRTAAKNVSKYYLEEAKRKARKR